MRKLDLKNYSVSVINPQGVIQLTPYKFKDVLVNILTHPQLGLNGIELLEVEPLLEKIEKADIEVILTDEEYYKIYGVLKRFKGFSHNDMQFVKRITNCPEVPDDGKKVIEFSNN